MSDSELIKKAVDVAGVPGAVGAISYIVALLVHPEISKDMAIAIVTCSSSLSGLAWNKYVKVENKKEEEEKYKESVKRKKDYFINLRNDIETDVNLDTSEKKELRKKSYENQMESK